MLEISDVNDYFEFYGVSNLNMDSFANKFVIYLSKGMHADMKYMEKTAFVRMFPKLKYKWAKTVLVFAKNYYRKVKFSSYRIALYALYRDYHKVLKKKLQNVAKKLRCTTKIFVDYTPLMEKVLALKSGIGILGKNSCIITKKGSFFFICGILTDMDMDIENRRINVCKKCRLCESVCPTNAIKNFMVDSRKCISYHTIENRGTIPEYIREKMSNWIFGCDICQLVCPYNRDVSEDRNLEFREDILNYEIYDFLKMRKKEFVNLFLGTPVMRTGYECFIRNVCIAASNNNISKKEERILIKLSKCKNNIIKEHAKWAIKRLK